MRPLNHFKLSVTVSGPDDTVHSMSSDHRQQRLKASAAAASLVRALNNPYNVPAYAQPVNPQGYTYSSTYNLSSSVASGSTSRSVHTPHRPQPAHWYTSGSSKCTYQECGFTGSQSSLEIHKMDRHLLYPPGWHARKRQSDWDADPSLKGYVLNALDYPRFIGA